MSGRRWQQRLASLVERTDLLSAPSTREPGIYDGGASYTCDYDGAVEVRIEGSLWTRTWWSMAGSVTEYTPAAKARLGTWDTRFENDYARWLAIQPPAPPSCDICT